VLPPLLVDVNIAAEVVEFLRAEGVDVVTVVEIGGAAWTDDAILAEGLVLGRFVLTHDSDFARLALGEGQSFHGILRLRPGDEPAAIVIEGLRPLLVLAVDWKSPMVAVYRTGRLRIRRPSQ